MKTIFIIITRGFIVRNILRCGVLDLLKKAGFRIVIFFPRYFGKEIPKYLRQEFEDGQVIIEGFKHDLRTRSIKDKIYRRIFQPYVNLLTFGRHTWIYCLIGPKKYKPDLALYLKTFIFIILSKINIIKRLARFSGQKIFTYDFFGQYFEKYQPDLVFSTSVNSTLDEHLVKEATARGVKTISMTKGWDNAITLFFRFVPDKLIVQNELMKEMISKKQHIKKEKIEVAGFPQFDWYAKKNIILGREEYLSSLEVSPEKKLIFFGSEGKWMPDDDKIADIIVKFINENRLVEPCTLLIRPHFSDIKDNRFARFKNIPNVIVDKSITISNFFIDNWDPREKETKKFINLLYHCDLLINFGSTLNLDAACFDKPLINVAFGALYDENKEDFTALSYQSHLGWISDTGALDLAFSERELLDSINKYLRDPKIKQKQRHNLVNKLCYRVDGRSSERIAEVILSTIRP